MFQTILTSIVIASSVIGSGLSETNDPPADPTMNIVEVAAEAGSFGTLITAVKAAGLAETLSGEGPFTVFAPTDEAFAKIPESDLAALLEDKEALTAVLTYHVVSGEVYAKDVMELSSAKTVNGQEVTVKVLDGTVMIDDASVVSADIQASNGVIHVIDRVILPKM